MKILGSDFDNTIYFLEDSLKTNKNVSSIRKYVSEGNIFIIITGRTYSEIKPDLNKIDIPYTYLICGDGALIFDSTDYCLSSTKIPKETVEQVFSFMKEKGYEPYLEDGYNITNNPDDCIKITSLYATNKEDGIKLSKEISEKFNLYAYASRKHINVNNPINNKNEAIQRLMEIADLNKDDIYVIGDDINDYEMLEYFKGAIITKHNPILDELNLPNFETISDYIESELSI